MKEMTEMNETRESAPPATEARGPQTDARPRKTAGPKKAKRRAGVAVNDPVGDMLTRLRNAIGARHETVEIPASRLKAEIARVLKAEGYVSSVEESGPAIVLRLKYAGKVPALMGVDRVSRPGRRSYARRDELPLVLGGLGTVIVSTSSGVMTGREARRKGLGGEILAKVW